MPRSAFSSDASAGMARRTFLRVLGGFTVLGAGMGGPLLLARPTAADGAPCSECFEVFQGIECDCVEGDEIVTFGTRVVITHYYCFDPEDGLVSCGITRTRAIGQCACAILIDIESEPDAPVGEHGGATARTRAVMARPTSVTPTFEVVRRGSEPRVFDLDHDVVRRPAFPLREFIATFAEQGGMTDPLGQFHPIDFSSMPNANLDAFQVVASFSFRPEGRVPAIALSEEQARRVREFQHPYS